jgi:hypothetical protein
LATAVSRYNRFLHAWNREHLMDLKPNIKSGFGPITTRGWNKISAKANERTRTDSTSAFIDRQPFFIAKITASTVVISGRRWKYEWEEGTLGSTDLFEVVSGSSYTYTNTGDYAYNTCEALQQTSGTYDGPGITHANIPSGYTLQPIADGTYVHMFVNRSSNSNIIFTFTIANAIDGTCA